MEQKEKLSNRIVNYILKQKDTTLSQLENVVVSHGFTLDDLYTALEQVHRNKSIARTVRQGEVVYMKKAPPKSSTDHLAWVRANYPHPDNFEMPFPEIEMSFLFLRTKEERDAFRAEMSGRPVYVKNKYGKKK